MEIHHYIQNWKDYKKVIVVSNKGSVFIDLYEYPLYVRYLSLEVSVNLLIQDIKRKLDFTDRKCLHESN